jgi:hypothetical protein
MKKIFLLFAFAIAALCAINLEARQTDELPEEIERQAVVARAIAVQLMRAAGRNQRLQRARQQRAERRQRILRHEEALAPMPQPAPAAFAVPRVEAFEAPNAPLRQRRVRNQDFPPRGNVFRGNLFQ